MGQEELRTYCVLDDGGTALMRQAYDRMQLTARSYDRILGWPGPSLTWTSPRPSRSATWLRPFSTARPATWTSEGRTRGLRRQITLDFSRKDWENEVWRTALRKIETFHEANVNNP